MDPRTTAPSTTAPRTTAPRTTAPRTTAPRTTAPRRRTDPRRRRVARPRRRPPAAGHRPTLYLGVAAAGALLVNVLLGVHPAAEADPRTSPPSAGVAARLGLTARSGSADVTRDLQPLEDLAASRGSREAEQSAAREAQAAADRAALARRKAEAEAAARAAADAATAAAARAPEETAETAASAGTAAEDATPALPRRPETVAAGTAATLAHITNSAGAVKSRVQAAANAVVSNVPGAEGITLGGTRASATDPGGHPSGLALDYMVRSDTALGNAIVQYHVAHWDELGVDYLIYRQRMLSSPSGSWQPMADRGSPTANHMDHVHVNYRP